MRVLKIHGKKVISFVIVLIFITLLFLPFQKAVVFYYEHTNQLEAYLPVETGDTFQIIFTHSIHLTDVIEKYRISVNDTIVQTEIVFEQFGIGMPANADAGGEFVYEDGKYRIKNLENEFPSINIRNGKTVSKHRLVWGKNDEHIVQFNKYFQPGAWYTVKVDQLSIWQMLKGVKIRD